MARPRAGSTRTPVLWAMGTGTGGGYLQATDAKPPFVDSLSASCIHALYTHYTASIRGGVA